MNTCAKCGGNTTLTRRHLIYKNDGFIPDPTDTIISAGTGYHDGHLCASCLDGAVCAGCSTPVTRNQVALYSDRNELFYHLTCYYKTLRSVREGRTYSAYIGAYNWKPETAAVTEKGYKSKADTRERLFGVELEVDRRDDADICSNDFVGALRRVSTSSRYIYLKHDGSLSQRGFEIVSVPMTLGAHNTAADWTKIFCELDGCGYTPSHVRCGLHIHVSKKSITLDGKVPSNLIRMFTFVNLHDGEMCNLGGRTQESCATYARFMQAKRGQDVIEGLRKAEKYRSINFVPKFTVEFRLFRCQGLMHLLAMLDLCDAVCEYCIEHSIQQILKGTWDHFKDYINSTSKKKWANLKRILDEGYVDDNTSGQDEEESEEESAW